MTILSYVSGSAVGCQPLARVVEYWSCYFVASGDFLCSNIVVITEQSKFWLTGVSCYTGTTLHEGQQSIMMENLHFKSEGSTEITDNGNCLLRPALSFS